MTELQRMAKIQAVQVVAILAIGRHPDYVIEKASLLSDPNAFMALDDDNVLDVYFKMWNLTSEWENYKVQVKKDRWGLTCVDFREKYKI